MKHIYILLISLYTLLSFSATAQIQDSTITIPNGSFENWSNGSGYSVTVLFFPLSVYDSYIYPTDWDFPTYPVNESLSYSGMSINVNTDIPLLKVSNETNDVYDGSNALKMQSFRLSDIISSTVYSLAQPFLDSTLTTSVLPTILSTGVIDLEHLLAYIDTSTNDLDSLPQIIEMLSTLDVNYFITGGISLEGNAPGKLTGLYKYTSAASGTDNGGIVMVGTKYNPVTQRREIVGGGYTLDLADTSEYTPFEVLYAHLSEFNPSAPNIEADSLIILLFSSANNHPQQGSALFLDNLQLWIQQEVIPEDTCSAVFNLHVISVDTTQATIGWSFEGDPTHFEVEYDIQGFEPGSGTPVGVTESFLHLSNLQPDTYYDLYVRCVCDSDLFGDWASMTFHTDTVVPPVIPDSTGIHPFAQNPLRIYPNPAHGHCVLQFTQDLPDVVRLFAIDGTLLLETVPNKETLELNLPSRGIFILNCEMKDGAIVRKIVNQ